MSDQSSGRTWTIATVTVPRRRGGTLDVDAFVSGPWAIHETLGGVDGEVWNGLTLTHTPSGRGVGDRALRGASLAYLIALINALEEWHPPEWWAQDAGKLQGCYQDFKEIEGRVWRDLVPADAEREAS